MSNRNIRKRAGVRSTTKAQIIHAQVILILLGLFAIVSAIYLIINTSNTFIPARYMFLPMVINLLFLIPAMLCFKYPKLAFIIIGLISLLTILQSLAMAGFFQAIFFSYILGTMVLGYRAVLKRDAMGPIPEDRDDILDHDF